MAVKSLKKNNHMKTKRNEEETAVWKQQFTKKQMNIW